jgi:glucose/mannose transport system substrate-binding protein
MTAVQSDQLSQARGCRIARRAWAIGLAGLASLAIAAPLPRAPASASLPFPAQPPSLQVLHWWTSSSERQAADVLARRLAEEGVAWRDAAVPGGAGLGAGKVLRSLVLSDQAPEVTQLIGRSIGEWADAGLLLEFDGIAAAGHWRSVLAPTVMRLVQHRGHVVAAPLGVHRVNTLLYNRRVLARAGLRPPTTWAEFEAAARVLQAQGVVPLAQSSEPWQVATLFETLVLAEGGAALHQALFVQQSARALADPHLVDALLRLRRLRSAMASPLREQPWTESVSQVLRGEAAMLVMGDWAKAEMQAAGAVLDEDFGCLPAPGTAAYHLYSVDTLSMFAHDYGPAPAQEKLARLVVSPAVQAEYNAVKGSVPVRLDADPARMDACARASWTAFTQPGASLVPSLAHRMATDEASRDVISAELQRYFLDDSITPAAALQRLGAVFRALRQRGADPAH